MLLIAFASAVGLALQACGTVRCFSHADCTQQDCTFCQAKHRSDVSAFCVYNNSAPIKKVGHCGVLLPQKGFGPNLPGKPTKYALTAAECCAFCHSTGNCSYWTWNGPPPGNGMCYAKASNAIMGGSKTMISGGVTPGPPMPPPAPATIKLVSDKVLSVTEPTYASWNIDSSCNRGFHKTNFSNPNLLAAAKGLAPSKLRFGGSGNDALVYGLTPGSPECADVKPTDCGYITPG